MAIEILNRTKRDIAETALGTALGFLGDNPDKNAKYVTRAFDRTVRGEKQALVRDWVHSWLEEGQPGREFLTRILKNTHPNVRRRYIARMVVSLFFRDAEIGERALQKYGVTPPHVLVLSPTMRCNYRCQGCYAASYERKDDMSPELCDRVLTEAEEMGTNFFVIVGGEPFIYPELLKIIRKHNRSLFQVYTNASLIDEAMAAKLADMGNVTPQISVNGPAEFTDASRGKGTFELTMRAMDNLRKAGCVIGFSTLVTRLNVDAICSEEWMDLLIQKGALYGWLFLYMPVGSKPDINLMPTPEQRNQLRVFVRDIRHVKPIIPIDFWNDGPLAGGCISAGREYCHINHKGDVEPCIFCHFATNNIKNCSLAEALGSPFFKAVRDSQPFSHNTLLPCPMIDHHGAMWSLVQQYGAKPTHEGADQMFTTLAPEMKRYSEGVQTIMDDVWDNESYHDWAAKWGSMCGIPTPRLEARRQAYEESRHARKRA